MSLVSLSWPTRVVKSVSLPKQDFQLVHQVSTTFESLLELTSNPPEGIGKRSGFESSTVPDTYFTTICDEVVTYRTDL